MPPWCENAFRGTLSCDSKCVLGPIMKQENEEDEVEVVIRSLIRYINRLREMDQHRLV